MPLRVVRTDKAPRPLAPYSQGVRAGDYLFISGQVPVHPQTGNVPVSVSEQTIQALENVRHIVKAAGASMKEVVKVTVFLVDVRDFEEMNRAYGSYFRDNPPARSTVGISGLARPEWKVEIEAIAYVGK